MKLASLASSLPFVLFAACSSVAASGPVPAAAARSAGPVVAPVAALVASAGDITGAPGASLDDAAIARLRAEGPPALARLLAESDRLAGEPARQALAATIDRVAGQRYATESRLYWYTDLEAAKAVARATGKPILSLRMLGRLDQDLSCANSRLFRTTLYPDAAVSQLLRAQFVLHWSSERLVPKVTIDFGDGRRIESTVTGNSAHYVLDADGAPLEVLPGLYAAPVFVRELAAARVLHASLRGKDATTRTRVLLAHHRAAVNRLEGQWDQLGKVPVIEGGRRLLTPAGVADVLALAQRATFSKAYIEVPLLKTVDVGADPGALPRDVALWAEIGQRLLGVGDPPAMPPGGFDLTGLGLAANQVAPGATARVPTRSRRRPILDRSARTLVERLMVTPAPDDLLSDEAAARALVIARLEQTILADTALNEVRLRPLIRQHLINQLETYGTLGFDDVNRWIYDVVFHTPREDAWLGLVSSDTFTGLPAGGIVAAQNGRTRL